MLEILQSEGARGREVVITPGPATLLFGDLQAGYYGETASSELITGPDLAGAIGLTAGTAFNNTANWLKFAYQGKTLYIAKKPFRYSVAWSQINAVGAVYGTKTVVIAGKTYRVRLMHVANTDPANTNAPGGELIAIFAKIRLAGTTNPAGLATGEWVSYTNVDLGLANPANGNVTHGIETFLGGATYNLMFTGTAFSYTTKSNANSFYSWRPVLELVD